MNRLTLITEQLLARVPGGTGRWTAEAAVAIARAAPPGWQITGVTARHADLAPARVAGVLGPRRLPVDPRVLARLWQYGLPPRLRGRVVHAFTPLAPRPRRGQALVVTVHDAVPFTHPETLTSHGAAWHRRMIGRAARSAAAIVVPTRAAADDLLAAGVRGRIEVVGAGRTAAMLRPVDEPEIAAVRRRHALPGTFALMVGTLEPRKGLDVALDALALLPDLTLAVAGQPGWGGTDLRAEAARRGLGARVRVLGRLEDEELAGVLAGAAVCVQPSRAEGFGLPALEAMSRGVPVVHSDVPAMVEVAGGAGITVPIGDPDALADGVRRVLDDPALAARLSAAGTVRAADFDWAQVAQRIWRLYQEVGGSE